VGSGNKTNKLTFYWLLSAATTLFVGMPESHAALPPSTPDADEGGVASVRAQSNGEEPAVANRMVNFAMEPLRVGGALTYNLRHDSGDGVSSKQQGITTTLNATSGLRGYIWQPWLSNFSGSVGVTTQSDTTNSSSDNNGVTATSKSNNKNTSVVGNARLTLLPRSRFPFEMHIEKSDTRTSNSLSADDSYSNQRYGFSQRYTSQKLTGNLLWDRSTQFNEKNGGSRQDNLQLSMTPILGGGQSLQLSVNSARNSQERTGEHTSQDNITTQHTYTPSPDISFDSSANLGRSSFSLAQGESGAQYVQLSTLASWRPKDNALTMTGGVRLFALTNEGRSNTSNSTNNSAPTSFTFSSRTTNFNVGANYDFSKYTRLSASGNLNLNDNNGTQTSSSNESVGLTYNPEQIKLDKYVYNWSTSANATNSSSGQDSSSRQLSLQLSHGLSRNIDVAGGSLSMNATQTLSSQFSQGTDSVKQLAHSGSLTWNLLQGSGTAFMSLTISDSRTLGSGNAFQMANFQASSNLPTGRYSSWTGNLTIQAVRQTVAADLGGGNNSSNFTTTSSGSISYQNQRAFGVPRLRFVSDIRLNSQALLPVLSGPDEQATSSWDNSLDYSVGRTLLRLNTRFSKSAGKANKSILFTATRQFGNS
jgi:hypothetical protein